MAHQQSESSTKQVEHGMKGKANNPDGKGGFGDNPQNRSDGGWKKEMVFSYQYRRFMNMSVEELRDYAKKSDKDRTVVEDLAYARVVAARKSLPDVKEITDRTEGKAPQSIDMTTNGKELPTPILRLDDVSRNISNQED